MGHIKELEQEWARYKYLVLEKSPGHYQRIRQLLKDKGAYPREAFYTLLREALETETTPGRFANGALYVWGYFKGCATPEETKQFQERLDLAQAGEIPFAEVRELLRGYAEKYEQSYLLASCYFLPLEEVKGLLARSTGASPVADKSENEGGYTNLTADSSCG